MERKRGEKQDAHNVEECTKSEEMTKEKLMYVILHCCAI